RKQLFVKNHLFLYVQTIICHLILFTLAYYLAFAIKNDWFQITNAETYRSSLSVFLHSVWIVLAIKLLILFVSNSFRDIGYYATIRELQSIIINACIAFVVISCSFGAMQKLRWIDYHLSLSILLIDLVLTILFRGGWRLARRYYFETILPCFDDRHLEPAFLIGANDRGVHIANIINTQRNAGYRIVGFITRHDYKVRLRLGKVPIVANVDDLAYAALQRNVKTLLFVAGSLPGSVFRNIYDTCKKNGLKLEVIPQIEFLPGSKIPIREIMVDDLLKREEIRLDTTKIEQLVTGRRVMVTGAGGSIGSEICRQLMQFEPKELFLLGRGENRIFFLEHELNSYGKSTKLVSIIADVSNADRIDGIFNATRPEIVFHAAAHKHVPLMEANIPEAIYNNIYGTKVVADASDRYGTKKFIMISTDKAVNPSSIMGCSKQMAERYVNALAVHSQTKFIVTRFGNVLGSNGSVVPIFTKQIQLGGPITITDRRMTRYFMTIQEASQLVLEAAAMGVGGEIFVLDMGNPVKIETLAKDMIHLAGLPENAIEIKEIGLRPGEKLYEELYFKTEKRIKTDQKKLFAAEHRQFDLEIIQAQLDELLSMLSGPQEKIRERLQDFIPEYKPSIPKSEKDGVSSASTSSRSES
ncbi:MAG: polysaccharide biosynthesis protein, partial [Thermoguttaceae bacterium]|nr:polysaccharide biosynthesis protein [Thermoguttaceae bacterium]